jgi:DNA mismatch repair protein MutL
MEVLKGQRRFIQIHNSYILAETDTGFIIIDQHALHEKILFEKMCRHVQAQSLESQRLLIAQRIQCNEQQAALVEAHGDLFHALGIQLESFGPRTYAIRAFPTLLNKVDPEAFVYDVVDLLVNHGDLDSTQLLDRVLNMAACKAAIKAGQKLSCLEIEQLLSDAHLAESSSRCPHGRPTTIQFTLDQLNKQFLRI